MEMTLNKENSASFSLLMATMPQANSMQLPAKPKTAKEPMQAVETDFSERLSAALDESSSRGEPLGKVAEKKGPEKTDAKAEVAPGSVPFGIVPVATEPNTQTTTSGAEVLVDMKNAALQGLAAATATVLPMIVQTVAPAVLNSPVVSSLVGGVANVATELLTTTNAKATQSVQQLPLQTENVLQSSMAAGKDKTGAVAVELLTNQPVLPQQSANNLPVAPQSAVNKENSQIVAGTVEKGTSFVSTNELSTDIVTTPQQAATPQSQGNPVDLQQLSEVPAKVEPASTVQQQIQQDMRTAKVSTVTTTPTVLVTQSSEPISVQDAVTTDTEDPEPAIGKAEPTLDTVVKTTTEQEVPKRSMSHSETDLEAGLSEKNDASLSVPVGFDKVMASVNEPAVVTPPVAQPRPDLHEVVKQVMDGMISPAQQLKSSQVIITLKPEHLGEVTVKINVDGDKVTAAFHAASTEVRGILESSLSQLKQEMSQQGWQFDSDGVFGGMQEFLGQQEQQQAQQQQMRSMINHARPDEYDDTTAFTNTGRLQVMTATAVDYRV